MELHLKYGEGQIGIEIPEHADVAVLEPNSIEPVISVSKALLDALSEAVRRNDGISPRLSPEGTIAIAIPDETRPLPVSRILPFLLDWLFAQLPDLNPERITIIVGGGLHPPVDRDTLDRIVPPEITRGCRVICHDAVNSPLVYYGLTSFGTPVHINAVFANADYKVVVGQIDPHQFVGFTGGAKGAVVGCGGKATIEHNHSLMFNEEARVGVLDGNPVREDLNEAGKMAGVDLAVNVVMAPTREVVRILAGRAEDTLREGAQICAQLYGVGISEKFDIIVASCGGYPKDICLYQAQKGLNLASQAVKKGGKILLLAASPQGIGDDVYFDYVSQFATPEEVLADFRRQGFKMGAHKAYLFGRTLSEFDVAVCSELDSNLLQRCHLRAADPSLILAEWIENFEGKPKIGIIPNANTTYFYQHE